MRVWQPIRFDGHFVCDVAIDGLPKPIRYEAFGFDPLQALTAALQRLWHALAPYRESIAWLGHRGEHGLPFAFGPLLWPVEQRRLEQLVQSEIERCNETSLQPANRWEKSLREKYDPEADDAENDGSSTAELVERLREASVRARTHRVAGNDDGTFAFESKMRTILRVLRERPDFAAALQEMIGDGDRALRLLAAQILIGEAPHATEILERLRDDALEPEAAEAVDTLQYAQSMRRAAERPRPGRVSTIT